MKVGFCDRCGRQIGSWATFSELAACKAELDERGHCRVPHSGAPSGMEMEVTAWAEANGHVPLFAERPGITLCGSCQKDFERFMEAKNEHCD